MEHKFYIFKNWGSQFFFNTWFCIRIDFLKLLLFEDKFMRAPTFYIGITIIFHTCFCFIIKLFNLIKKKPRGIINSNWERHFTSLIK